MTAMTSAPAGAATGEATKAASDNATRPEDTWTPARRWVVALAVLALVVVAGATLGDKSLFKDEGFSVSTSWRSWPSFVDLVLTRESNGALYSLLLWVWLQAGTSEAWLRLPSLVAMAASVVGVAALAGRWWNPRVGMLAAVLFAVHGSVMAYAQQVRTYAFVVLAAVAVMAAFAWAVRTGERRAFAAWGAAVAVATGFHVLAPLLVLAGAAALPWAPGRPAARRGGVAVVVCALALAPVALLLRGREEGQALHTPSLGAFRDVIMVLTGRGGIPALAVCVVLGAVGALVAVRRVRQGDAPFVPALLLAWLFVPGVTLVLLMPVQSLLIGRYLLLSLPAGVILMAVGLDRLAERARAAGGPLLAAVVMVAAVAGLARGAWSWLARPGEDFRGATHALLAEGRPGDAVVFANDSVRLFTEYYLRRAGSDGGLVPAWPAAPWGAFGTGDQTYLSATAAQLAAASPSEGVTWVLVGRRHDNVADVDATIASLTEVQSVTTVRFAEDVHLIRIERGR